MIVKTMRGKDLDMAALKAKNAHVATRGNLPINARGDLINKKTGEVIKPIGQIMMEYNKKNLNSVKHVPMHDIAQEVYQTPAEAVKQGLADGTIQKIDPKKRKLTDE